jgi:hypothetical protein
VALREVLVVAVQRLDLDVVVEGLLEVLEALDVELDVCGQKRFGV